MVEYLIFLLNYLMNYYTLSIISYYIPIESKTVLNFMKLSHRCADAILERKQNYSMDSKFIFESPLTFKLFYPKIETLVLNKGVRGYINELIYISNSSYFHSIVFNLVFKRLLVWIGASIIL